MEQTPLPSSLNEVEALISALYEPAPPETIARIQEVLQRLQRSPQGWKLAHDLLERPDEKTKFFGALTIIIKLNTESASLGEDDSRELLLNLIQWFVRSASDGSGALVIRKLCSALVTYFIHFSHRWASCVHHLVYCLDLGRAVPVNEAEDSLPAPDIIGGLDEAKLQAAIWFAASFVEETGKTDMNSAKYVGIHKRLIQNTADVTALLARGLSLEAATSPKVRGEAVSCLQSWILYAQRAPSGTDLLLGSLRALVVPAMTCLMDDDLYDATIELFTDVLSNFSSFLTELHYDSLYSLLESDWSRNRYAALVGGDFDFDAVQYGLFMIAFGDAKVQDLIEGTEERHRNILKGLCGLLNATGYPVAEDKVFVPALEFWSTFVETMTDLMYSEEDTAPSWMPQALSFVMEAIEYCYHKIQLVDPEAWKSWDSTERVGWDDARKDVADFLQAVYPLKGASLVSTFAGLLLQALPTGNWAQIEAALFCLAAVSDCVGEEGSCDADLDKVFSSSLLELLTRTRTLIPYRLLRSGLSLIERYSDFFERHHEHLPTALNVLFNAIDDPALGSPASKSIYTLCSSCRSLLAGQAGVFLTHYQHLHTNRTIDSVTEERVVAAVASVIQAIPEETQRLQAFEQLLATLHGDAERCLHLRSNPGAFNPSEPWLARMLGPIPPPGLDNRVSTSESAALFVAERTLRCVASMARGMQGTTEAPIDLDGEPRPPAPPNDQLLRVQGEVMAIMSQLYGAFCHSGEVVETVCNIFRAGFSETEPGPFVFPPDVIIDFFTRQTVQTPRIGTMVSTMCSFVSSLGNGPGAQAVAYLSRLLPWVVELLKGLPEPESDTELAQNGIEFVHRVMVRHPEVLIQLQPTASLESFFLFALNVLNGKEPLPKGASAEFWAAFITLTSDDGAVQAAIDGAMEQLGPLLSRSLVQNMGGNASRSELDKLSDPLKKLVVHTARAQGWLESALLDPSFPSTQVSPQEKSVFLKKIINLRGARTTNKVVREFWLACRGSSFAYAS